MDTGKNTPRSECRSGGIAIQDLRQNDRAAHQFLQMRAQPRLLAAGRGDCKKAQDYNEQDATHKLGYSISKDPIYSCPPESVNVIS